MEAVLLLQGQKFSIFYIRGTKADVVAVVAERMDEASKKQFLQLMRLVAESGPPRNEEKCRKVKSQDGLFELKPGSWRVPFFYSSGQIMLTHAFPKEGSKAQTNEFEYAAKIRDEYFATLTALEEEKSNTKPGKQQAASQTAHKSVGKGKSR